MNGVPLCHYCVRLPATTRDHIVPRTLLRRRQMTQRAMQANVVPACGPCNQDKADTVGYCHCPTCSAAWVAYWNAPPVFSRPQWNPSTTVTVSMEDPAGSRRCEFCGSEFPVTYRQLRAELRAPDQSMRQRFCGNEHRRAHIAKRVEEFLRQNDGLSEVPEDRWDEALGKSGVA